MKQTGNEVVFKRLGDLRISGPEEEVEAFMTWLKSLPRDLCYFWGADEIRSVWGVKSYEVSVDLFPPIGEMQ